jgi:hypothetical protein
MRILSLSEGRVRVLDIHIKKYLSIWAGKETCFFLQKDAKNWCRRESLTIGW